MAKRGQLTPAIQELAVGFLGREIDTMELRMYPYFDFVMKNDQKLEIARISGEERKILQKLKEEGHIEGGASGMSITKEFFDYMQRVLWLGYVAYREEDA